MSPRGGCGNALGPLSLLLTAVIVFGAPTAGAQAATPTWPAEVSPADTVRYTVIVNGMTAGERLMWQEPPDTWGYRYDIDYSDSPRTERRVVTVIKDGRVYDPAAIYRALGIEPCCQGGRDPPRRE